MPQETDRLKLPLPLGNETVTRESINGIFEKIDAGVATQADLDALREAVSKMDIPDASLTQKGKVQLSNATESTSQTLAATSKAVNDARQAAENNAKGASLPRTGGALTGRLTIQSWGSLSANTDGNTLYGNNCYLHPTDGTFRFENTHSFVGARGVYLRFFGSSKEMEVYMFDTGSVATTAGEIFTPTLKRIINADDVILPNDNPTTNFLSNSTGLFGLDGWTSGGAVPFNTSVSGDVTGMFYVDGAVPSGQYAILDSVAMTVYAGIKYDLQAMFFSSGSYTNSYILIEVKNVSNGETLFTLNADPQKWWHRKKMTLTMPTGVSQIKLRLVVSNAPAGVAKAFSRIRFNLHNLEKDMPYDFTGDLAYIGSELKAVKRSGVDAKQGVVNAINAKGGSASTNDTWAQLAAKINAIQQGAYSASEPVISYVSTNISAGQLGWVRDFAVVPANAKTISISNYSTGFSLWGIRIASSTTSLAFGLRDANGLIWRLSEQAYGNNPAVYALSLYTLQADLNAGVAASLYLLSGSNYGLHDVTPQSNVGSVRLYASPPKPAGFDSTRDMTIGVYINGSGSFATSFTSSAYGLRLQTT